MYIEYTFYYNTKYDSKFKTISRTNRLNCIFMYIKVYNVYIKIYNCVYVFQLWCNNEFIFYNE